MQKFTRFVALLFIVLSVSSFTVVPVTTPPASERITAMNNAISEAAADGKFTSKEVTNIFTIAKGEKLTLKERIALKVCGKKIKEAFTTTAEAKGGKSQLTAALLCFFLGGIGIHRFYLGYTWQGIVQILTLGGLGIWALIDFVRILMGTLKPKDGEYEKTL